MQTTGKYFHLLHEFKLRHAKEYGIIRIGIFGSVARGEQSVSSDVDICIDAPPMSLFKLSGLHLQLEELLGTPVDIVRMRDTMNPKFKQRIEKEIVYV